MRTWRRAGWAAALAVASLVGVGVPVARSTPADTGGLIAQTAYGAVQGRVSGSVRAFLGVPYAAPPTGSLRWKPPHPPRSWGGVRDATAPGSDCPALPLPPDLALSSRNGSVDEDCLYLNVYAPPGAAGRLSPVMVWFHGGGFANGAGTDVDPSVLAAQEHMVVVTANYRLGPFGFLALPSLTAAGPRHTSGNFGIQDQQAALRWVQENIRGFGGDPRNMTVSGQSAGAISTCVHLMAPQSQGLFERAIIESGPCTRPMQTLAQAEQTGLVIAGKLGCGDPATQLACMYSKPVSDILAAGGAPQQLGTFGPNVDGVVIPQQPAAAIASGAFDHVPVIQGTTHDEYRAQVYALFDLAGAPVTAAQYPAPIQAQFGGNAQKVLSEYPLSDFPSPSLALATAITDANFSCPALGTDRLLAAQVPVYAYEFTDQNAPPYLLYAPVPGAIHASDLPYIFQPPGAAASGRFTPAQLALSRQMMTYWGSFAASGNPTGPASPPWPRYAGSGQIQSFNPGGSGPASSSSFAADHRCAFWASL